MAWLCNKEITNETDQVLFRVGKVYEECDDRGEAEDDEIAICLTSELGKKTCLVNDWVRNCFTEINQ